MGIFDAVKKFEPVKSSVQPVNMPVVVEAYDVKAGLIIGTNLETNEKVQVYLREDTVWDKAKGERVPAVREADKKRKEVADFANKRDMSYTQVGGVVLVEACFPDKQKPGVYSGQWLNTVMQDPDPQDVKDRREVTLAAVRVYPPTPGQGDRPPSIRAEILRTESSRAVSNEKELADALLAAFETDGSRNPFAVIRVANPEINDVGALLFPADSHKEEIDGGIRRIIHAAQKSVEVTLAKPFFTAPEGLMAYMGKPGYTVEVIPGETLFLGKATAANAIKHNREPHKAFLLPLPEGAPEPERDSDKYGFNKAVVSIARYNGDENGNGFVTALYPLRRKELSSIHMVPTPIVSFSKKDAAPAPAAPGAAPSVATKPVGNAAAMEAAVGEALGLPSDGDGQPSVDAGVEQVERASRRQRAGAR